jgi:hypothetical protein
MLWLVKTEILENASSKTPRSVLFSTEAEDLHEAQLNVIRRITREYPENYGFVLWQVRQFEGNPCREMARKYAELAATHNMFRED